MDRLRIAFERRQVWQGLAASVGLVTFGWTPASAQSGQQRDWRYCGKCHSMFFDGYSDKGGCPSGGGHSAIGYNFSIEYSAGRTQELPRRSRQYDWRFCNKCHVLFFDGYPTKGVCARGGGHIAQGYIFGLWDTSGPTFPRSPRQPNWRFCNKCNTLFFDGYANKGSCAAGGGHVAQGLNFVIFHDRVDSGSSSAAPQPPSISVIRQGGAFKVIGSAFTAGSRVTVRVADDFLNPNLFFQTTATSEGVIEESYNIPCQPGRLHFSANDGRANSQDLTGTLWSNTFTISC